MGTETNCKPRLLKRERNSSLDADDICQGLSKSAPRLSKLVIWQARSSNSFIAARNQISRKHVASNLSCTRPELSELTTALLLQYAKMRRPHQWRPHNRRVTTIAKASNKWIAENRARTLGGNSTWKNSPADIPLLPVKQASVEKTLSGEDHNCVGMNETPL